MKRLLTTLLFLLSNPSYSGIAPALELTAPGIHLVCSMPTEKGQSYCVDIDIDLKRQCQWDHDKQQMTCGAVGI